MPSALINMRIPNETLPRLNNQKATGTAASSGMIGHDWEFPPLSSA
jgi:hypothetical protein